MSYELDWQPTMFHGEQIGIECRGPAGNFRYQIGFAPITVYVGHDQVRWPRFASVEDAKAACQAHAEGRMTFDPVSGALG